MCGIAGQFVLGVEGTIDSEKIVPMVSVLGHRGPDEWGYYVDDARRTLLVHARLSIIDLTKGRQPLANEDGSIWVAANGEIYEFERLAADLKARGHRFRTQSDSEVIVHLYEEFGEKFVEHLRGEFAFALFDARRQELYLVRDRFGIKPLYYSTAAGSLLFGSEMKALFCHGGVAVELEGLNIWRNFGGVLPPGETLFRNVRQVEPGTMLVADRRGTRRVAYWDLVNGGALEASAPGDADGEASAAEFRRLLEESVRIRLRSDVPVGIYLSGGMDSSTVACLVARMAAQPVKAFTIGFDDADYDETDSARRLAETYGMEHHVLRIQRRDLAAHFPRSIWHSEMMVANTHGTAKLLLSELAHRHVKVVLTGEGADELLAGYDRFKHQACLEAVARDPHDRLARKRLKEFLAKQRVWTGMAAARAYPNYQQVVDKFGVYPYPVLEMIAHQTKALRILSRTFRRTAKSVASMDDLAGWLDGAKLAGLSPLAATQYMLFKTSLPNYILNYLGDRQEMANAIEGRLPFLDHKLVEFAWRLPDHLKLRDNQEKYILHRAMADLLPEGLRRQKQMFLAPPIDPLESDEWRELVEVYLTPARIRDVGVFRPTVLRAMLRGYRFLRRGSYNRRLCEMCIMEALSLHILDDLFRRNFQASVDRFARPAAGYRQDMPGIRK